ncbi:hypothetical protein [Streptomyces sp. NBC_00582]|uniref:hypothetical protein n=1 Tax=Streptomyces sp. NBC_00582 TaxID=2975783 RepID=UPI002E80CB09|nr:hypothetical protein [Streptomyces sp. NBC_00582]WUB65225.1 hypothetical protein OG852_34875 [Streptomyces sp. NBC_00582]
MTFGDQGTPHAPQDPCARQNSPQAPHAPQNPYAPQDPYGRFVAGQELIRRRRARRAVGVGAGVVLVGAIAAGAAMAGGGDDGRPAAVSAATGASDTAAPGAGVPSVGVTLPSDAPGSLPSLLARPVIRPEQAFPAPSVRLSDGSRYTRVDLATTTDCTRGTSPELAELIEQGAECSRLTAALFTDADRLSQITVTVLSFARVEDASRVFMMASTDPVTYQVVSLDPPPKAGLPTVPPGSAGVFRRVMTVRSVVFANGQWGDGKETGEAELTAETEGLLRHVNDRVVAYEEGRTGSGL